MIQTSRLSYQATEQALNQRRWLIARPVVSVTKPPSGLQIRCQTDPCPRCRVCLSYQATEQAASHIHQAAVDSLGCQAAEQALSPNRGLSYQATERALNRNSRWVSVTKPLSRLQIGWPVPGSRCSRKSQLSSHRAGITVSVTSSQLPSHRAGSKPQQ